MLLTVNRFGSTNMSFRRSGLGRCRFRLSPGISARNASTLRLCAATSRPGAAPRGARRAEEAVPRPNLHASRSATHLVDVPLAVLREAVRSEHRPRPFRDPHPRPAVLLEHVAAQAG